MCDTLLPVRLAIVAALLLVAFVRTAEAGWCDEDSARTLVADTEAFAAGKTKAMPDMWDLCFEQEIIGDDKLTARFVAACETITTSDPNNKECVRWSIELGATKLGGLDLFEAAAKLFPFVPFGEMIGIRLLAKLGDNRGVALVQEAWLAGERDKRSRSRKSDPVYRWSVWRHAAIKLFAAAARKADVTFLAEAHMRTKDAGVKRALAKAIIAAQAR